MNSDAAGALVEQMQRADRNQVIEALASAFREYPVMRHVLADAGEEYEDKLRHVIGFFVDKRLVRAWPALVRRRDGRIVAAALVNPPAPDPSPEEYRRLREDLRPSIGQAALERLERYEKESDRDAPVEPHHFLGVVGVAPGHQGEGHARALLDEVHALARRDSASTGVCLNTEDRRNVAIYEHLGYRVLAERQIDDLHTWCMFRSTDR